MPSILGRSRSCDDDSEDNIYIVLLVVGQAGRAERCIEGVVLYGISRNSYWIAFSFLLDAVRLNTSPPADVWVELKAKSRRCEKTLSCTGLGLDAESSNCSQQIIR